MFFRSHRSFDHDLFDIVVEDLLGVAVEVFKRVLVALDEGYTSVERVNSMYRMREN